MSPRQALFASAALALSSGAAQAFTLHVAHFNDFHSRVEFDQRLRVRPAPPRTRPRASASAAPPGS